MPKCLGAEVSWVRSVRLPIKVWSHLEYGYGSIFRRFDIPKVPYSEGSIFRRFDIVDTCLSCEDIARKNSPSGNQRTALSGYIFATKARIDNRKNVKQQYLLQMPSQYGELGPLAAEIVSLVWGTPANFNGFRVLAALLHGTLLVGVSQTLRR